MPGLYSPVINHAAGGRRNKHQPYRIVARIGSGMNGTFPPMCWFLTALRALRASTTERVLILSEHGAAEELARAIARQLSGPLLSDNTSALILASPSDDIVHGVLRTALRVVWGDSESRMPQLLPRPRARPYEVVWTWCVSRWTVQRESNSCNMLPESIRDFEVQARWRGHAVTKARRCSGGLAYRSTWAPEWQSSSTTLPSPDTEVERPTELKHGEWILRDACIGLRRGNPPATAKKPAGSEIWHTLAQARPGSRQLLWPLPWRDLYSEYAPGFYRFDSETIGHWLTNMVNISASASPASPLQQCTWHNESTAFLAELTMDNLFHALVHVLPLRELFSRAIGRFDVHRTHLLPHYVQYWPTKGFARSIGWQILAHSVGVTTADWPKVAARAEALAQTGCHCYPRVIGGHAAWMPPPYMQPQQRVLHFRQALAITVVPPAAERRILFLLRRNGVRQIVNEEALRTAVDSDPTLVGAVKFVVMETLPVMAQYRLVSSSRSLAGMHGQGLAWSMLLASDAGRGGSSCLEITGRWHEFRRLDYYSNSLANGVRYKRLVQPNAPECESCKRCSYRTCGNVTVDVSSLIRTLHDMMLQLK